MPNWSQVQIQVDGTKEQIGKLSEAIDKFGMDIEPCTQPPHFSKDMSELLPEERSELSSEIVDWRREHWGTKWDMFKDCDIEMLDDTIIIMGQFAWKGPDAWLKKVCGYYGVNAIMEESEPGCNFVARLECESGDIVDERTEEFVSALGLQIVGVEEVINNMVYLLEEKSYRTWSGFVRDNKKMIAELEKLGIKNLQKIFLEEAEEMGIETKIPKVK